MPRVSNSLTEEAVVDKNNIQLQTELRALTGKVIRLGVYDELMSVTREGDDKIYVFVRIVRGTDTRAGLSVKSTGTALHIFTRSGLIWNSGEPIVSLDSKPDVDFIRTFGRGKSESEHERQEDWQSLCYRPGTSKSPMDNLYVREMKGA